jgi:hypothetical protein
MVKNIKQTGYGLREMAELLGKRGCCKKGTCIHKKAVIALKRIDEVEGVLKELVDQFETTSPLWQKAKEILKNGV